ncbi:MAG: glycosyltransferase [Thermoanaerobaculia bacterium]|nr:glycosyltransferase [Thermoanaerobaculia bacterium]
MNGAAISVVIPSYSREGVLVETVRRVVRQLGTSDEILIIDQSPTHEPETETALADLERSERVFWYRKSRPSICEAMNVGALLARNEVVLFLDDDVVPAPGLLEAHREVLGRCDDLHAVNGQVLQPWHDVARDEVDDFELGFDFAYAKEAEVVALATGNLAVRRRVFLAAGGMDETFAGGAYRCDADLGFRLWAFTGRRARFEPRASVRHLQAGGGTRAHGAKDSWASIESAIGDHYFGMRWFSRTGALRHSLRRLLRAPFNRRTLRRPWLVPWLLLRELVAFQRAVAKIRRGPPRTARALAEYQDLTSDPRQPASERRPADPEIRIRP